MENQPMRQMSIADVTKFMGRFANSDRTYREHEISMLIQFVRNLDVNVYHENIPAENNQKKISRVIIRPNKFAKNIRSRLAYQANGIVIDSNTWKVISMPPERCQTQPHLSTVKANIANYDIYEINDGTTVTLYYWGNKWCFSTANAFEVNNYKWIGERTFSDVFTEITGKYEEFSLDKLDKNCSYSIGFRSHHYHPFKFDKECAWFIRCFDLTEMKDVTDTVDIGIPKQKKITVENTGEDLLNKLLETNDNAYSDFVAGGKIHYGYILRANNDSDGIRNVCLESKLLKTIRKLMYDLPKRGDRYHRPEVISALNSDTTQLYCSLRAYLQRSAEFDTLFPDLVHLNRLHKKTIESIIKLVTRQPQKKYNQQITTAEKIQSANNPNKLGSDVTAETPDELEQSPDMSRFRNIDKEIQKNIALFWNYVRNAKVMNKSQDSEGVIRDLLTDPNMLDTYFMLYMRCLNSENQTKEETGEENNTPDQHNENPESQQHTTNNRGKKYNKRQTFAKPPQSERKKYNGKSGRK